MVAPSSLLYWTSSSSSTTTTTTTTSMDGSSTEKSCLLRDFNGGEQKHVRTAKGSSRNKSGKVLAKKPPQRGLGVAQLERLRIQERWKKMTEIDGNQSSNNQSQLNQFQQFNHHQFPFQEQQNIISSVPMNISAATAAAAGFTSPMNIISGQQQICNSTQPAANFVFNPYRSGGSSGVRSVFSDHVQSQAGNGNHHYHQHLHPFESAAKELSSSQKSSHCLFDQCDVCLKKKRMNNGENLGFEGGGRSSTQYLERKSFEGCDFLGLDLGRNWTSSVNGDGGNQRRASYSSGITTINDDDQEEVEVVAIHRKGKTTWIGGGGERSSSSSTTVLMEYDFFPRKTGNGSSTRSSRSNSMMMKKEPVINLFGDQASSVLVGESSSTSSSSSATTNLLDLSLKLSC